MTGSSAKARALAVAVVGLAVLQIPSVRPASAAEGVTHVTTASTRTVAWTDQNPRNPGDEAPAVRDALKDFRLTVSQTEDLLNQTVEVSWEGGVSTAGNFLQLMQCWSDGPTVQPRREQCAYGGLDREATNGTGSARTRALGADPRETTYRNDGDLSPVTVNGASVGATWAGSDEVVFGTSSSTAVCPEATTGYTVSMVPSRGTGLTAPLVLEGPTSTPPASLTRKVGKFTRTFPVVTAPVAFGKVAAGQGLERLPAGTYRVQLACNATTGIPVRSLFVSWVQVTAAGVWSPRSHEGGVFVPFDPLGDAADDAATDPYERNEILEYVKPRSTNEIWQAKGDPSGGGDVFMELLTDLEAPHLGCGRAVGGAARSCWLVAVPRWAGDPDGKSIYLPTAASPLSQTLWDRRVAVPLAFAPVASGCRIGSGLKQVLADDSALQALRSWQPVFCDEVATAASVLGPLPDFSIRAGFSQPNRMGVTGVPEEGLPATVVTAPVATSAVVIGFSLDRRIPYGAKDYALDGTRETTMNLTPRLLAKLLTQSYDSGAAPNGGKTTGFNSSVFSGGFSPTFTPARSFPQDNPRRLYDDPEFLALNPAIASWVAKGATLKPQDMADLLVAAGDTDAYHALWQYVVGDPEAQAFVSGTPDPYGMRVNPYYEDQVTADLSTFPQLDPTCADVIADREADSFPLLCQLNDHPRVEDDAKAAQAAVRGDTRRTNVVPVFFGPTVTSYGAESRQDQGERSVLVVTTSAVAQRYGLPTARLRNAEGNLVEAVAVNLAAARDQMLLRTDGVLVPQPDKVVGSGYPLTTMSYAQVDVAVTTQDQNDAFATILHHAATEGQVPGQAPGQLPPGYAPLTPELTTQTEAAAALLEDPSRLLNPPEQENPVVALADAPLPPGAPSPGGATPPGAIAADVPSPPRARPAAAAPRAAAQGAVTSSASTPVRWAIPGLLLGALLAGLAGRLLTTLQGPRP